MAQETRFRVTRFVWGRETMEVERFLSQRAADVHIHMQLSRLSEEERMSVTYEVRSVTITLEDDQ